MIFTATPSQPQCLSVCPLHTIFSLVVSENIRFNWLWQIFNKKTQILTELFALSSSLNKPSNLLLLVSPVVRLKQNNLLLVCLARGWSNEEFSVIISHLRDYSYLLRYPDQTRDICVCWYFIFIKLAALWSPFYVYSCILAESALASA